MISFLKILSMILGAVGFIQVMNALGSGSLLLATLTLLGAVAALSMAGILERLDRIAAKP